MTDPFDQMLGESFDENMTNPELKESSEFEIIKNSTTSHLDFYNSNQHVTDQSQGIKAMILRNVTNLGYHIHTGSSTISSFENKEAYIFSQKYFGQAMWQDFMKRFKKLKWITYCEQFKPLLMEICKWLEEPV